MLFAYRGCEATPFRNAGLLVFNKTGIVLGLLVWVSSDILCRVSWLLALSCGLEPHFSDVHVSQSQQFTSIARD